MDLGLVYNPMLSPAIETHPLANARLHLICPPSKQQSKARPNCPVTLKSLANYPLIIPSRPNAIRMLLETSLASAGVKSHVAWEIDGVSSILDLVNAGHGFAVLPLNALDGHKAAGRLIARPVVKPSLSCMIGLSASSHRRLTPLAQCVRDLISETMRYVLPEDQGQKCRSRILNRNP
jgi:LysR family nitrogen assimilation transcriptional regulator